MSPVQVARLPIALGFLTLFATAAAAQDAGSGAATPPAGVWLTTPYPSVTETAGAPFTIDFSLINRDKPPVDLALKLDGLPDGWSYAFNGGGHKVDAAMVAPGDSRAFTLKLTPPKGAKVGSYHLTLGGSGDGVNLTLPVTVSLAEPSPTSLALTPKLPALRGSAKSAFDYTLTVKNDGAADVTVNLDAAAPPGFDTKFTEEYGSQELSSLPVKANATANVKLAVTPPPDQAAGSYPVHVAATDGTATGTADLALDITGAPHLALNAPDGRLSGSAVAGKEKSFTFTVANTGGAPAKAVKLDASAPSGWKTDFSPADIPSLAVGAKQNVEMRLTPSDKAIAGDYMVTVSARGTGASDSTDFRVTVETSTLWGIIGIIIIAAALLVLALAVFRYGRR